MGKGDKIAPYFCTVFLLMIFFTAANLAPLLFDFPIASRILTLSLTLTAAGTTGSSLAGGGASVRGWDWGGSFWCSPKP
jgi:hypothetical protein